MSSHYIYLNCKKCNRLEPLFTGNIESDYFDDNDWEEEFIKVPLCKSCKEDSPTNQSRKEL